LFLEVSPDYYIRTIRVQKGKKIFGFRIMQEKLEKEICNNSCKLECRNDKMNFTAAVLVLLHLSQSSSSHGCLGLDSFLLVFMDSYENLVNTIIV
jgi:hypothetical protein